MFYLLLGFLYCNVTTTTHRIIKTTTYHSSNQIPIKSEITPKKVQPENDEVDDSLSLSKIINYSVNITPKLREDLKIILLKNDKTAILGEINKNEGLNSKATSDHFLTIDKLKVCSTNENKLKGYERHNKKCRFMKFLLKYEKGYVFIKEIYENQNKKLEETGRCLTYNLQNNSLDFVKCLSKDVNLQLFSFVPVDNYKKKPSPSLLSQIMSLLSFSPNKKNDSKLNKLN